MGYWIEIVGHAIVIVATVLSAGLVIAWRQRLRRTTRRPRLLYWAILAFALFAILSNLVHPLLALSGGLGSGNVARDLGTAFEFLSMIGQMVIIVALVGLRVTTGHNLAHARRILVIGAHPDDIEIACGATLARLRDEGHRIHGLVLSRGERGGEGMVRQTEARNGARFLGLDSVTILDCADTRFQEAELAIMQAIEAEIAHFRPDIILTHSAHDLHQDHQTVHTATLRAARNVPTVLAYESPSVTSDFRPALFVNVSDYLGIKVESIREHQDQADKPYTDPERVRGIAAFRGGQAKVRYAEGFEVVRMLLGDLPSQAVAALGAPAPGARSVPAPAPSHTQPLLNPQGGLA